MPRLLFQKKSGHETTMRVLTFPPFVLVVGPSTSGPWSVGNRLLSQCPLAHNKPHIHLVQGRGAVLSGSL